MGLASALAADGPTSLVGETGATVSVLVAVAVLVGGVSAVSPFLPVEAYVVGAALTQRPGVALAVAAAAGLGQTVGKTAVFESARLTGRSSRLARLRARALTRADLLLRPPAGEGPTPGGAPTSAGVPTSVLLRGTARLRRAVQRLSARALALLGGRSGPVVVLLSAAVSLPPLLVVAVYAGASPMRRRTFVAACFLGRTARFCTLALLPGVVPT